MSYTSTQPGLPDAKHERHFEPDGEGFVYRLVVEYEPRGGIARLFDGLLLDRGIRRAFQSTFVALERKFEVSVRRPWTPRVLIVGAGVAGLALARALRARNITAELVERMPEWETSVRACTCLATVSGRSTSSGSDPHRKHILHVTNDTPGRYLSPPAR